MTIITRDQNASQFNDRVHETVLFSKNIDCEEVEMGIATDGMEFVLEMLTDLSVNRGAYALRETWSNAYDATVATGDMTRRIDIIVPDPDDVSSIANGGGIAGALLEDYRPTFAAKIIDHGIGMTYEDVKMYFTQYGGSKKRSNTEMIGSKGLGSKAALAASDSFTVVSVHDGVKTTAIIERRNRKNVATLTTEETDEANGTTIEIPVADAHIARQMSECAYQIARYNLDANLYVNGEKTESFLSQGKGYTYLGEVAIGTDADGNPVKFRMWQDDDRFMYDSTDNIDLNLAGVRYQLSSPRYYYRACGGADIVIAGDPGYLNFTPSRDEIKDDEAKRRFVAAVKQALRTFDFTEAANARLASFDSIVELSQWVFDHNAKIRVANNGQLRLERCGKHAVLAEGVLTKDGIDYMPLFAGAAEDVAAYTALRIEKKGTTHFAAHDGVRAAVREQAKKTELVEQLGQVEGEVTLSMLLGEVNPKTIAGAIIIDGFATPENFKQFSLYDKNIRDTYDREEAFYMLVPGKFAPAEVERPFYEGATVIGFDAAIEQAKKTRRANSAAKAKSTTDVSSVKGRACELITDGNVLKKVVDGDALHVRSRYYRTSRVDFSDTATASRYGLVCGKVDDVVSIVEAASLARAAGKLEIDSVFVLDNVRTANAEIEAMLAKGAKMLCDCRKNVKNTKPSELEAVKGLTCTISTNYADERVVRYTADLSALGLDVSCISDSILRSMLDRSRFSSEAVGVISTCLDKSRIPARFAYSFEKAAEVSSYMPPSCRTMLVEGDGNIAKSFALIEEIGELAWKVYNDNRLDALFASRYGYSRLPEEAIAIMRPGITEAVLAAIKSMDRKAA